MLGISQELDAEEELVGTIKRGSPSGGGAQPMVAAPVAFKVRGGKEGGGKGYLGSEDKALTISTVQEQYLAEPLAFALRGREDGATPEVSGDRTNALRGAGGGSSRDYVTYPIDDGRPMEKRQNGLGIGDENAPSYTLDTTGAQAVAYGVVSKGNGEAFLTPERHMSLVSGGGQAGQGYPAVMAPVAFAENSRAELRLENGDGAVTGALSTGGGKPGQGTPTIATAYAVRRLTPRECERLQGFPDDHTRYYPDGTEIADTHRYRMLGNAVSVPVAAWIAQRIKAVAA